ncbi:MAG: ABC transporter permease [Gemmatimonadota bacterium]|nr:MAG: ABC transporter permease [Gemmatimonadota bacterium]
MSLTDMRYAARGLRRNLGFTAIVVLTLGLGVGANTAIFSVVSGVLLEPLPFEDPDELVTVWEHNRRYQNTMGLVSPPNFADWREQSTVFAAMGAAHWASAALAREEGATRVVAAVVTPDMFSTVLRARPVVGRVFTPADGTRESERAVILSYELWMREFGGAADLVGSTVTVAGHSFVVVGIMPAGFRVPVYPDAELWIPLRWDPYSEDRSSHFMRVVARLKPTATVEQTRAEMGTIMARLEREYPEHNSDTGVNVVPLKRYVVGDVQRALYVLLGAVGFVLLIACANVAGLLLARATVREREYAVREALGAGRGRLVRQAVTESMLLALLGGGAGLLLAFWGVELLLALGPGEIPRLGGIGIDGRALGFTLAVAILTGLLVGVIPAIRSSRPQVVGALKTSAVGGGAAYEGLRARRTLVIAQVAIALVLLGSAGLLIRSFGRLVAEDLGFDAAGLVTARISLAARYPEAAGRSALLAGLLDRLSRYGEAGSVAASTSVPFGGWEVNQSFEILGRPEPLPNQEPDARIISATPSYFRAMGIPIVRGRDFRGRDGPNAPRVVIINESAARLYWPGEDPIGQRVRVQPNDPEAGLEIVGVVGDVRFYALDRQPTPEIYYPYRQVPAYAVNIVARVPEDPARFVSIIRDAVRELDPSIPVYSAGTFAQMIGRTAASQRFYMIVLGIFAVVAATLAAVGIYGVLSYSVARRANEIGVRVALGASPSEVLTTVIAEGCRLAALGLVLGLISWLALGRVLTPLLHEIDATDPLTILTTALVIVAIAFLASYLPARRATRVDPMVALRVE